MVHHNSIGEWIWHDGVDPDTNGSLDSIGSVITLRIKFFNKVGEMSIQRFTKEEGDAMHQEFLQEQLDQAKSVLAARMNAQGMTIGTVTDVDMAFATLQMDDNTTRRIDLDNHPGFTPTDGDRVGVSDTAIDPLCSVCHVQPVERRWTMAMHVSMDIDPCAGLCERCFVEIGAKHKHSDPSCLDAYSVEAVYADAF